MTISKSDLAAALAYVAENGFGDCVDDDSVIEEAAQELLSVLENPPAIPVPESPGRASAADVFDHTIGAGGLSYNWWVRLTTSGEPTAAADWSAELTCEDGEDGTKTATVSCEIILAAAWRVLLARPEHASDALVRECGHLLFAADMTDFDAPVADELLQFIVLGGIVFG